MKPVIELVAGDKVVITWEEKGVEMKQEAVVTRSKKNTVAFKAEAMSAVKEGVVKFYYIAIPSYLGLEKETCIEDPLDKETWCTIIAA